MLCSENHLWCTVLSFGGTRYGIQRFHWLGIFVIVFVLMPPINPTPRPYLRVTWIRTLGHMGGGNRCEGDTLLRVTMTPAGKQGSGLPKSRWKVPC